MSPVVKDAPTLAPGVPTDYYDRIFANEQSHWWYGGMLSITASLLGRRLARPRQRLLDAGCGTGGFLSWALDRGDFASVVGVDIGSAAVDLARQRLPSADFHVTPLRSLPFADESFDLVVSNDVLQHVHEREVEKSLRELRRVLTQDGTLLVRTNGARRSRRERDDWRVYDGRALREQLEDSGFECERLTHANMLLSLYGATRGNVPNAPSMRNDGIPRGQPSGFVSTVGRHLLAAEAAWLRRPGRSLPYGHTLFAVGHPA
jgi:SAM-dependent methyltransferase